MTELILCNLNAREILILSNSDHPLSFYDTMTNSWYAGDTKIKPFTNERNLV